MYNFAKLPKQQREELIQLTAGKIGIAEALVEKDFWVTVILNLLFEHSSFKEHILFKGGTSLSKGFKVINRFSEDIDIILDWRVLGIADEEAWKERSNNQHDKFNKHIDLLGADYIKTTIKPELETIIQEIINNEFKIYITEYDPYTICIEYPKSFNDNYLLPIVKLEIGPRASRVPYVEKEISAYVIEAYPSLFSKINCKVKTIKAERTFWEKITILHSVAKSGRCPLRYSRHYYDTYSFIKSSLIKEILSDVSLLDDVVKFKSRFYVSKSAHYDTAKLGTIQLIPSNENILLLEKDYKKMGDMLFGEIPIFEDIIEELKKFETILNS